MTSRDCNPIDNVIREMRILLNLLKEYELAMEGLKQRNTAGGRRTVAPSTRLEPGEVRLLASVKRLDELTAA
jgi:hypothetical protein